MDIMSWFAMLTVSLPEFLFEASMLLMLIDGKRYLNFKELLNVLTFTCVIAVMLVISYVVRRFLPNLTVCTLVQAAIFYFLFKFVYFKHKKWKTILSGFGRFYLIEVALEMATGVALLVYSNIDLNKLYSDDMVRLLYSLPVTAGQILIFITCWKWKDAKPIKEYKSVRNLSFAVETLLLISEVLVISDFLSSSGSGAWLHKITSIVLLLILSAINVLYLYTLNVLGDEIFTKLYTQIIELRGELNNENKDEHEE